MDQNASTRLLPLNPEGSRAVNDLAPCNFFKARPPRLGGGYHGPMRTIFLLPLLALFSATALATPRGSYSNGQLENAVALDAEGPGYVQLFREFGNYWGDASLVSMIRAVAAELHVPGRDRLQVEEISAQFGGPISEHLSHQNGLDVDIGYYKNDGVEHVPRPRQYHFAPSMVAEGTVTENFDVERNWELMKALHRHGNVARIFVDQVIKDELIRYARSQGEFRSHQRVINSLLHVDNHADHMHVRLRCPPSGCLPLE